MAENRLLLIKDKDKQKLKTCTDVIPKSSFSIFASKHDNLHEKLELSDALLGIYIVAQVELVEVEEGSEGAAIENEEDIVESIKILEIAIVVPDDKLELLKDYEIETDVEDDSDNGENEIDKSVVTFGDLCNFLFPSDQHSPNSWGRLLVFAHNGPLTKNSKIIGGKLGNREIGNHELKTMIDEISEEDVLTILLGKGHGSVSDPRIRAELLREVGKVEAPIVDIEYVKDIIAGLANSPDSSEQCSFHDLQREIFLRHNKWISKSRAMYPSVIHEESRPAGMDNKGMTMRSSKFGSTNRNNFAQGPPKQKKLEDIDRFRIVSSLLNRSSHHVAPLDDLRHPGITQNAILMRSDSLTGKVEKESDGRKEWNNTCCFKKPTKKQFL